MERMQKKYLFGLQIDENNHLKLSMEKIAEAVPISRAYLQDLKSGKKNCKLELIYRISQVMQVEMALLLPKAWIIPAKINENALEDALVKVLSVTENATKPIPCDEIAHLVTKTYNKNHIQNKNAASYQ